jgi:cytochrome c peroxidase
MKHSLMKTLTPADNLNDDSALTLFSVNRKSGIKRLGLILFLSLSIVAAVMVWLRMESYRPVAESRIEETEYNLSDEPLQPLPLTIKLDEKKVSLGEKLFNDPQLSRTNAVSCSSCHSLSTGGTDQSDHSTGVEGRRTDFNAPTVFNSDTNFKQFWDGRGETLEDQIDGPIQGFNEMDSNWPEITNKLKLSPEYQAAFAELYPEGIQSATIKDAITVFERSLSTPNSRFDRFLRGTAQSLSDEEKEGYRLFKSYGCASCHQGVGVGGNMFQRFGVMGDYFADRGNPTKADLGRFNVTGNEADRHLFKVPGLRNIALTAPYFHDGSASSLEEAVSVMAKYQLGRHLSSEELHRIVGFLKTLSGEYKGKAL